MNGDKLPFGVPPTVFMQTGNQTLTNDIPPNFENEPNQPEVNAYNSDINSYDSGGNIGTPELQFPPPFSTPTSNVQNKSNKYQIVDIFWLLNQKYYNNDKPLQEHEAQFVVVSFNITFNNLRVSFFNLTQGSIQGNVAFLSKMQRTVSGTIYPASAFHVVNDIRISKICLEQLWQATGEAWQQNRPICKIEKNEKIIRLTIQDNQNGTYFYDFTGWQREAFIYACQFVYTTGLFLCAQNALK